MSLDITIKVDPGNAVAQAAKVETALGKAEDTGERIGPAISKSMREGSTAMDKVTRTADVLAQGFASVAAKMRAMDITSKARAFDSLTVAIKREHDMLEKIHGPMRRAEQDLQTLEMLHKRGAISTREYADEVTRLNRSLAKGGDAPAMSGAPAATAATGGADVASIAKGVSAINFKQAAQGAAQAFELLNQHLKITESAIGNVAGSVIKFGAAGAQIAGPIGAAVGAGVGALASLGEAIFNANAAVEAQNAVNRKAADEWLANAEAQAKAKREALEMAPGIAALAERQRDLAEATATAAQVTDQWTDAFRKANSQANAYADELIRVNKATGDFKFPKRFGVLGNPFAGASETEGEAAQTRGTRGLEIEDRKRYAAGKSYGDLLVELESAELKRRNRLEDLTKVMTDQNVSAEVQRKALKEYNKLTKEGSDATSKHADEVMRLTGDLDALGRTLRNVAVAQTMSIDNRLTQAGLGKDEAFAAYGGINVRGDGGLGAAAGDGTNLDQEINGQRGAGQKSWLRMNVPGDLVAKEQQKDAITAMAERQAAALASLEQAAGMAGDALVDAFMGADISGKELLKTITSMLAKQALGALIGAGFGALGGARTGMDAMVPGGTAPFLPGFATGGDMLVGGSGGPDTKIAAFKVSPGESIHVRTPQQRDQTQRSPGGGSKTININVPGVRDAVTEHNLEGLVVRVVERNNPALRSRLRG